MTLKEGEGLLNYIWFGMIIISIIVAFFNGRLDMITKALIDSSKSAIDISIELLGMMCMWLGIMKIAESAGLIEKISSFLKPLTKIIFSKVPSNHPAMGAMLMNIVANLLGLGNAATPLGLKAMNELQKLNKTKDTATNTMCMFLIINTCSIQLIPATLIAIRSATGSKDPTMIIAPIWISSLIATTVGIILAKITEKRNDYKCK